MLLCHYSISSLKMLGTKQHFKEEQCCKLCKIYIYKKKSEQWFREIFSKYSYFSVHQDSQKERGNGNLHSGLYEVQSEGQGLSHEDVRVVGALEGLLQLLQLPAAVVGPSSPLLHWPGFIWKPHHSHQLDNRQRLTRN